MQRRQCISLATLLLVAGIGCVAGSHGPLASWSRHRSLTAGQMATYLAEVSSLAPDAVPAEIARLEGRAAHGSASDRLKLAYLFSRTDAPTSDPDRAWEILKDLAPAFRDKEAQAIAHVLARAINLERELRVARNRATEAQQKIERLKGLERELDDSSNAVEPVPRESLPDAPEAAPPPAAATHGEQSP